MKMRVRAVAVLLVGLAAVAQARMTQEQMDMVMASRDHLRDVRQSESHEFFVLVKPEGDQPNTISQTEQLATDFKQRLGQDKNVKVSAVSKVRARCLVQKQP
jgi:hypothetical protein